MTAAPATGAVQNAKPGLVLLAAATLLAAVALLVLTAAPDDSVPTFFGRWKNRHFLPAIALIWVAAFLFLLARSRRWLFTQLFVSILAMATVGLLELVGLVGLIDYRRLFEGAPMLGLGGEAVPHLDHRGETFQDLAHMWGHSSEPIPFEYKTDRRGYRNEIDREAADLYLLGDSIVVAGLVPFPKTMTSLLEQRLAITCMNIALIGVGPEREEEMFEQAGVEMDGRLLLHFVFEGNDLHPGADQQTAGQRLGGWWKGSLLRHVLQFTQKLTSPGRQVSPNKIGRIGDETYLFMWTKEYVAGLEANHARVFDVLARLQRKASAAGGRYAVVYVPEKIRVLGPLCTWPEDSALQDYVSHLNPWREVLVGQCQKARIPLLDLTEPLAAAARAGRIPWFPKDTHLNADGHEVMVAALAAWDVVQDWRKVLRQTR